VTDLNKPVIVALSRDSYADWAEILGPHGNEKDVKVLCDFAKENKIAGYLIEGLTPYNVCIFVTIVGICN